MSKPLGSSSFDNHSIVNKVKEGYLVWVNIVSHIPKGPRYTIGARIENKFLYLLEISYLAYFTEKDKKMNKVLECIFVLDTLKFLIHVTWEAKFISHKQFEDVALKLDEAGKMLGGWRKKLEDPEKKNRTL